MKLIEFADIINAELVVRRYPNQGERWITDFDKCEVKIDGLLESSYGEGNNSTEATVDFAKKIKGKTIVFNAYSRDFRREFTVPDNLEF